MKTAVPLLLFAFLYAHPSMGMEELEIQLGEHSVRDPLLQFIFPPKGSKDKLGFSDEGIMVHQPADPETREPVAAGFKLTTCVRGDFAFELDVECRKLQQPASGWGHGLLVRFNFADSKSSLVTVGCISTPRFEKAFRVSVDGAEGEKPKLHTEACSFSNGRWYVMREGHELIFHVAENDVDKEVARVACPEAELLEVQIWATRLPKDNGEATFLLKRVRLRGDKFFARSEITRSNRALWPFWIALATTGVLIMVRVLYARK